MMKIKERKSESWKPPIQDDGFISKNKKRKEKRFSLNLAAKKIGTDEFIPVSKSPFKAAFGKSAANKQTPNKKNDLSLLSASFNKQKFNTPTNTSLNGKGNKFTPKSAQKDKSVTFSDQKQNSASKKLAVKGKAKARELLDEEASEGEEPVSDKVVKPYMKSAEKNKLAKKQKKNESSDEEEEEKSDDEEITSGNAFIDSEASEGEETDDEDDDDDDEDMDSSDDADFKLQMDDDDSDVEAEEDDDSEVEGEEDEDSDDEADEDSDDSEEDESEDEAVVPAVKNVLKGKGVKQKEPQNSTANAAAKQKQQKEPKQVKTEAEPKKAKAEAAKKEKQQNNERPSKFIGFINGLPKLVHCSELGIFFLYLF